ncbi:hypothetical protein LTR66_005613 [Elasticomyces elasticus]|nr:hypothetical protein LTR66_005613 [Elasticomyces elasticus]
MADHSLVADVGTVSVAELWDIDAEEPVLLDKLLKDEVELLEDTGTDPDGTGDNVIVVPPVVLVTFVPELNGSDAELPVGEPSVEFVPPLGSMGVLYGR